MNSGTMSKIISMAFLVSPLILLIIMLTGCGKSADDLYNEGKILILNEESFDKGVETLLLFEKKFPNDSRTPEVILAIATSLCTYVRKYDPPLLVDTAVSTIVQQEFTKVLDMNDDLNLTEMNNSKVLKHVRKNMENGSLQANEQGIVDVLGLYGIG